MEDSNAATAASPQPELRAEVSRFRRAFEIGLGIPFTDGNRITVLRNGDEIFPAMLQAIAESQATIDFISFVYWTGDIACRFAAALSERAAAGVRVQIVLDAIGAASMDRDLLRQMEDAGAHVVWFRPPTRWKLWEVDNRTHRKVLICDGRVGFTGGVGIAAEWEGDARNPDEWRETHFQIEGAAVRGLQGAFIDQWVEGGRPMDTYEHQPATCDSQGPSSIQVVKTTATVNWSDVATMIQLAITHARHRLRITTAYFVPGDIIARMLQEAVDRGVEVEVLVPGPHTDQRLVQLAGRRRYEELLAAGVGIWEYQQTMLHAKLITVDGVLSVIGSANINQRSMSKDDELVLMVLDPDVTAVLDRQYEEDLSHSRMIELGHWRRRSMLSRVKQGLTHILRPQL